MRAIGYREFCVNPSDSGHSIEKIVTAIQTNSRRYAKRQLTFFRAIEGTIWVDPGQYRRGSPTDLLVLPQSRRIERLTVEGIDSNNLVDTLLFGQCNPLQDPLAQIVRRRVTPDLLRGYRGSTSHTRPES